MDPDIPAIPPAGRSVPFVGEASGDVANVAAVVVALAGRRRESGDLGELPVVGPAGEGHRTSAVEQFAMGGNGGTAESTGLHLAEIADAHRTQVDLAQVGACGGVEALQHGFVGDRLPGGGRDRESAEETGGFLWCGFPTDGGIGRAGVGGGEFEGVRPAMIAAVDPHGQRPLGQRALGLERADGVAGALQRGEWLGGGAGVGVGAPGRDMEVCMRRGGEGEGHRQQDAASRGGHAVSGKVSGRSFKRRPCGRDQSDPADPVCALSPRASVRRGCC